MGRVLFMRCGTPVASAKRGLTLGNYQEIRVRHFERAVDKFIGKQP